MYIFVVVFMVEWGFLFVVFCLMEIIGLSFVILFIFGCFNFFRKLWVYVEKVLMYFCCFLVKMVLNVKDDLLFLFNLVIIVRLFCGILIFIFFKLCIWVLYILISFFFLFIIFLFCVIFVKLMFFDEIFN